MQAYAGRKLTVTLLGAVAGLCAAVLLQQAGVLPLDRVAAFGLPALFAVVPLIVLVARTGFARAAAEWIAVVITLVLVVMTAIGIPALASTDELGGGNGFLDGCTLQATSGLDQATPSETSRGNPFEVDPDGTVAWDATSDAVIMDHQWEIWVDAGGFRVPIADGGDSNDDGSQTSQGDREVRPYVEDVASVIGGEPAGIFLVGGSIAGDGGSCEGQAYVSLPGGVLSNAVGQGAGGLLVVLLGVITILLVRVPRTVGAIAAGGFEDGAMQ